MYHVNQSVSGTPFKCSLTLFSLPVVNVCLSNVSFSLFFFFHAVFIKTFELSRVILRQVSDHAGKALPLVTVKQQVSIMSTTGDRSLEAAELI